MPSTGTSGKAARLGPAPAARGRAPRRRPALTQAPGAAWPSSAGYATRRRRAAAEWTEAVAEAERWLRARRAARRRQRDARGSPPTPERPPELTVAWEPLMGIVRPRIAGLEQGPAPPISSLGGSSALHYAALAYRRATRAAAGQAAAQIALERVSARARHRRPPGTCDRAALDPAARGRPGRARAQPRGDRTRGGRAPAPACPTPHRVLSRVPALGHPVVGGRDPWPSYPTRARREGKKKHRLTSRHGAVQEAIELFVADATS